MRSGARIDRRDAEALRWLEAAASRTGGVTVRLLNARFFAEPWVISALKVNGDREVWLTVAKGRTLSEALEQARKDLPRVKA